VSIPRCSGCCVSFRCSATSLHTLDRPSWAPFVRANFFFLLLPLATGLSDHQLPSGNRSLLPPEVLTPSFSLFFLLLDRPGTFSSAISSRRRPPDPGTSFLPFCLRRCVLQKRKPLKFRALRRNPPCQAANGVKIFPVGAVYLFLFSSFDRTCKAEWGSVLVSLAFPFPSGSPFGPPCTSVSYAISNPSPLSSIAPPFSPPHHHIKNPALCRKPSSLLGGVESHGGG